MTHEVHWDGILMCSWSSSFCMGSLLGCVKEKKGWMQHLLHIILLHFMLFLSYCSPDDWDCFLRYLGSLLEDDSYWCSCDNSNPIHSPKFLECKLSHLSDEAVCLWLSLYFLHCPFYFTQLCTNSYIQLIYAVWFSNIRCIGIFTEITSNPL